ncbi:CotH kinase family protein [Hymenobacter fodinae]|uniref:T9SS type A sorting domain-containing protein n=1 Tax=Hymenobacter fodinae TaxID=2510796 RepID=A0A4Z0PG10_9BACT|nr:CotH kinase family protein [Hymenobacter fodinae]TGE10559.1 T9SS type A sorting domain-containing protein [Hymenobacter fodinae]
MRKKLFTLQSFILLCTSAISTCFAQTSESVTISSGMYHVDHVKKIILVNQDVQQINAQYEHIKGITASDKEYAFVDEVQDLTVGKSYSVTLDKEPYSLYFTQLPIIEINTKHIIADEPRAYAIFAMSETNGNLITSNLGIEVRGGLSQSFPKKSYRIEFWEDTVGNTTRDFSLLNMRNDDDWNLQALYNEPTRATSKSANALWQEMHQIYYKADEPKAVNGIQLQYAELFINNEYKGLYAVGERIDNKQLQLKKYSDKIRGELYKGSDWKPAALFIDAPTYNNNSSEWSGFEYEFPDEVIDWKNLHDFVEFVAKSPNDEFYATYKSKIHFKNAVDYFIFINVLRATDNVAKNVYLAKYKANEPYFFVPWDLDAVLGNGVVGEDIHITNDIISNNLYERLLQDYAVGGFRAAVQQRWTELRASVLTEENILGKLRANHEYLSTNAVYDREPLAWPNFQSNTTQLTHTSTWVTKRLAFLDSYFNQSFAVLGTKQAKASATFRVYPNPTQDFVHLNLENTPGAYQVSIQTASGKVMLRQVVNSTTAKLSVQGLPAGLYFVTVQSDKVTGTQKLVIN